MPALKGHHRRSKTSRRNPYAERGLDQFALVSAELQETREKLLAQFGKSLSLIRFAIGPDQTKWVPIIVAQTSSKVELQALKRAASDLIVGNKHAFDDFDAGHGNHTAVAAASGVDGHSHAWNEDPHLGIGSRISSNNTHVGSGISEHDVHLGSKVSIESNCVTSIEMKSDVGIHARISKPYQRSYLMETIQRLIWMLKVIEFSSRIVADIARNAIFWKRHEDDEKVRNLRPSNDVSGIMDHLSADIASASPKQHLSDSLPQSIAKDDIKSMKPLPILHVEAPKTRKISRFPSAPSTSPASRQLTKPIQACISFPRTPHSGSLAPHIDIKENEPAQKMIPNKALGSCISNTAKEMVSEKERKEVIVLEKLGLKNMSERLGQALTGAGLMLILSGLLMGYIPAIISIVCWWYALPSMRRAVGDNPFVRSHHHHISSPEVRNVSTVNNKARGKHVGSGKEDMHSHEDKKKVITNGMLDHRRRHHSQA